MPSLSAFWPRHLALMGSLILPTACVMIDSRASLERPVTVGDAHFTGRFACIPSYRSKKMFGEFVGPSNLGDVFNAPGCDTAIIRLTDGPSLTFAFERHAHLSTPMTLLAPQLSVDRSGKATWSGGSGCSVGVFAGCETGATDLFVNSKGDLVVVTRAGGLGAAFLVIPVAMYGELMSIFPRASGKCAGIADWSAQADCILHDTFTDLIYGDPALP